MYIYYILVALGHWLGKTEINNLFKFLVLCIL